ncbi:5-(carboxyamino)imidazole ribonucleotide synthase [Flaviflexus equikiangi]|uniref:N5-carboxyaminoimidazole ribonucleotide synthase n=1 Tax=Flaviflexus equikiangi TaxID=2758573 RepID=A0ABS2TDH0_9ACTO|nr:5-(carboxyamino)imidazole ribonucleotide synthase [Flaviflexus equikiangi]MBM9432691.1 5-(carboxyamino)imidazole ribonucleotide synthase [Flaviflexus equikiangi]
MGQKVVGTGARAGAPVVCVIGGGQLARMMQEAAIALGVELRALVEADDGSAGQAIRYSQVGAADDRATIEEFVDGEIVTVEHEHIPDDILRAIDSRPSADALVFAQDKLVMRASLDAPHPTWYEAATADDIDAAVERLGGVAIAKVPRGGYDGKGVAVIRSHTDIPWTWEGDSVLVEEKVPFDMEVSQLVARRPSGEMVAWPLVRSVQRDGICFEVTAPAPVPDDLREQAAAIAARIADQTGVVGVLAVEMFVVRGALIVNELAMRPHNTGHWTIEGAVTSQFEQHLRAVLDLPLGDTRAVAPWSVMVNLLDSALSDPREALRDVWEADPGVKIHMYGKEVRPGRKIGHVTVTGTDLDDVRARAHAAIATLEGR